MQTFGYIYLIIDHYDNKVYVGRKYGCPENSKHYYGSGTRISRIIKKRKYHLEKRIIGTCNSLQELIDAETECIYFYRSFGSDGQNHDEIYGYNLKPTGESGGPKGPFSKEHKLNLSNAHKGLPSSTKNKHWKWSEEAKQKQKELLKGNKNALGLKHSEETKKKISEKNKGVSRNKGCKRSDDTRHKLSDIKKGHAATHTQKHAQETKNKISAKNRGKKRSQETKRKMREAHQKKKKIVLYEHFIKYNSDELFPVIGELK